MSFDWREPVRRHHSQVRPGDIMQTSDTWQYMVVYISKQEGRVYVFGLQYASDALQEQYRLFIMRNFHFLMSSPSSDEVKDLIIKEKTTLNWDEWRINHESIGFFDRSTTFVRSTITVDSSKGIGNKLFSHVLQKDAD